MALVNINFGGITQPFTVQLPRWRCSSVVIVASPVWLFQLWGFICPRG